MKKCKSCQSDIDNKAKKCPKCQADQRNWFIKHKILTGILVIILITIVSNAGGNKNSGTNTTKGSSSKTTQTESIGKIGEPMVANDLSFTVSNMTKAETLGSSYSMKYAQGVFNIITLTIKNVGKETVTIDSSMLKIVDSEGRTFDRSIDGQTAKGLTQGTVDLFLQQVQPGLSVTGDIVFDLPDDVTGLKLLVKGSMFGSEKKISLDR